MGYLKSHVSGTATLHLVAHGVPAVVLYRISAAFQVLTRVLLVAPFIAGQIAVEWELCTPAALADVDPAVSALLGDPLYELPTLLPAGDYPG